MRGNFAPFMDIGLWKGGAKRHLNGTSKVNINTQTDKHMDKSTYRKHWTRWPML